MKTQNESRWPARKKVILGGCALVIGVLIAVAAIPPDTAKVDRAIQKDVELIAFHEDAVASQKEQLKKSKAEGDEIGAIHAKQELCKAKADVKRDRAHLKADKKALVSLHKVEMQPTESSLKESKRELCAAKRQLKNDMRQGNTQALVEDAQLVAKKQRSVDRYEARLDKQNAILDKKLASIDRRLEQKKETTVNRGEDKDQERLAWNATASSDKTFYQAEEETSSVLDKK